MNAALARYVLALADDALVSSQRLAWWISRAPQLEEDVALANIALDQLGQARSLLSYAAELTGRAGGEDELAYLREEREFRNVCLVERAQTDFGVTMARLLCLSTWQHVLYAELARQSDDMLAAIAAKAVKEVAYHRDHAQHWVVRLGDGTAESHRRMQAALTAEWPWVHELFDDSWLDPGLAATGTVLAPSTLREQASAEIEAVVEAATLTLPTDPDAVSRGRHGLHTEQMGFLLAEMQHLARSHPGATW
ncbi:1,2-phenylacetyl-CoA epoxidase subunit PaaC [Nocardioides houyundeii]|uniref:1,2-phenylacetyl-CoA epoxidase subunit PaaC n=1 Tax=Nocardioides houyundeii TaxID=2045452 RepID=UPI001F52FA72|nr:1,2-phenylacetyl-CoA epoxidase subunit PaaC [Nocardioides houyundeii]